MITNYSIAKIKNYKREIVVKETKYNKNGKVAKRNIYK